MRSILGMKEYDKSLYIIRFEYGLKADAHRRVWPGIVVGGPPDLEDAVNPLFFSLALTADEATALGQCQPIVD